MSGANINGAMVFSCIKDEPRWRRCDSKGIVACETGSSPAVREVAMDGFMIFMQSVCLFVFLACPLRLGDFATLCPNNLGGGDPMAALVHGDPAPKGIASASDVPPWRWLATIEPDPAQDTWKFGAAVSIHERSIAIGPARDWDLGVDLGGVQLYRRVGMGWRQSACLSHPLGDAHAHFGASVCLQQDMALIGAPRDSQAAAEAGAAFLFERLDDQWQPTATLLRSSHCESDQFGAAVACDQRTLVVGAPKADLGVNDSGAVEVFERDAHGWRNVATLVASPPTEGALFGLSVAISENRIVVGAPGDRTDGAYSGRSFIYTRDSQGWRLETVLACPAGTRGWFGNAVAVCQNRVLIGAPRVTRPHQTEMDARGAVYAFEHAQGVWRFESTLVPAQRMEGDAFGCSLALQGEHAAIGASGDSRSGRLAGAAYAGTQWIGGRWDVQRLPSPDGGEYQSAGHAVAIFETNIVVGRLGDTQEDPAPGAFSIFTRVPSTVPSQVELTKSPVADVADP